MESVCPHTSLHYHDTLIPLFIIVENIYQDFFCIANSLATGSLDLASQVEDCMDTLGVHSGSLDLASRVEDCMNTLGVHSNAQNHTFETFQP